MIKEFVGETEQEAIDLAITELGLDKEDFDVEVLEETRKGIFRKGSVKIRVHVTDVDEDFEPESDVEKELMEFLKTVIKKMGFETELSIYKREENKIGLQIHSSNSGILIGRKGKNLDALQLLANVYAGKLGSDIRVIVDAENYRVRREDSLIRLARKSANYVRKTKRSKLLEPMNPFERRLIHTTLNSFEDIDTKSEGDGLYKQVRIIYRGDFY